MNTKNIQNLIFGTSHVYLMFLFCVGLVHAQRVDVVDHLGNKAQTGTVVTEANNNPTDPKEGDIWIDTSKTPNTTNIWDGTDWTEVKPSYQVVLQDTDADTKIKLEESTDEDTIRFDTGGVERMRIDPYGSLLVGTTNATHYGTSNTTGSTLFGNGTSAHTTNGSTTAIFNRISSDGDILQFRKDGTTVGSIGTNNGIPYFLRTASGGGIAIGNTALVSADSSGAVNDAASDLGGSSNRWKELYLSGGVQHLIASGTNDGSIVNDGTNDIIAIGTGGFAVNGGSASDGGIRATANLVFITGTTTSSDSNERMRIDTSGNLLVGVTSISDSSSRTYGNAFAGSGLNGNWTSWGSGNHNHAIFRNGTNIVGTITTNSSATTTSYNTSSDQRLKENIVDAPSASDDIDAIQVRSFDWKTDGSHQKYGMIAQELQTVAPEAVSGDADSEDMMGVDYSKLVPM